MPSIRHADQELVGGDAIAVGPFPLARGDGFERHQHGEDQLAWTAAGALTVSTARGTWVLPRTRALWIPAGLAHTVDVAVNARMYSLYFPATRAGLDRDAPTVVSVPPLLGELIVHLAEQPLPQAARRRAEALVFDLLESVSVAPLRTPWPEDERALGVARAITDDPADERSLAAWGRTVGASERTLSRGFVAETGMTFTEWRTRARMVAALPRLAAGEPVAAVGRAVGYVNASAFIAAFRRTFGVTPRAYFEPGG
jgi:AraC-like DNA-binding protein/quercetin dioxygenase-like cupin family protein